MNLHGKNFVGAGLSDLGQEPFWAVDPARGERLEPAFCDATGEEVNRAMELAASAFQEARHQRGGTAELLDRLAEEIVKLGPRLIERAVKETGLPEARLVGERARTVSQIQMFAKLVRDGSWVDARIDRAVPDRKPLPKPDVRQMLVPLGPVVVFGASNFPLAFSVAGGDTASALAAGNPVVVKAHPAHPGTSELVGSAVREAVEKVGMPDGFFSMLHGTSIEVGLSLVRHPLSQAVGFTGSLSGGRALFDAAGARPNPIPVHAEMGSINPVFLLPSALADRVEDLAQTLQQSLLLGVGQFCTNPGLIVAMEGDGLDAFVTKLKELILVSAPQTMLHEGIRQAYEKGVDGMREFPGVMQLARSSSSPDLSRNEAVAAVFMTEVATFTTHSELSEEVFGPSTLIVSCRNMVEMETVARSLSGHLTATVHGTPRDLTRLRSLVSILESKVGRLIFNGVPTGVEVCAAMHHGGPYPATTDSRMTSVGTSAIRRFARPVCYQNFPDEALPEELRNQNVRGLWRQIDGRLSREDC